MKIGIDIDGVILNTEAEFSVAAELFDIKNYGDSRKDLLSARVEDKYDWSDDKIQDFFEKYLRECTRKSFFMPGAIDIINKLKNEGHELVIVTARGHIDSQMKVLAEEKFDKENLKFDKYYWGLRDKTQVCNDEKLDVMIDDFDKNCESISNNGIDTLYFRAASSKKLQENENLKEVHNWGEIYRYIIEKSKKMN